MLVIVAIVILLLTFLTLSRKETTYNVVDLPTTNGVLDRTQTYLDTIVKLSLKELNIEGISVLINPMESKKNIQGFDIQAYVVGQDGQYILYTQDHSREMSIEVIAHECVHIAQVQTGRLVKYKQFLVWDGDTIYDPSIIPYERRPWEREAFIYGDIISKTIKDILIKKE